MDLANRLKQLEAEIDSFACTRRAFVPDLVLLGLAIDVFESGKAVYDTSHSGFPHKAYSNARLAFEGTQQAVVLVTHERYEHAGATAWVYFESKDAYWRSAIERNKDAISSELTADEWLDSRVLAMSRLWDSMLLGQSALLNDALQLVRQDAKKRPDNWLHEDLTARQHRAYEMFGANKATEDLSQTAEINKRIYRTLCREAHARPRLDSIAIPGNEDLGTIKVVFQARNAENSRRAVTNGTDLSLHEMITVLRWRQDTLLQTA